MSVVSRGGVVCCLALVLAGCAQSDRAIESAAERRVAYACSQGETVEMRFLPQREGAFLLRQGRPIRLEHQATGSGFVYSNGPITVRGQGSEITIEVGRMVPVVCQVPGGMSSAPWRYGP